MRFTTLHDWLAWQESHHPNAIDLGLERVAQVADRLGITEAAAKAKVITVAGTNGKGSCIRTFEALLQLRDVRVGCYTSPHLLRYNERIRVHGEEASDELICQAFSEIDSVRGDISLTYFEFGTLAAMWLFKYLEMDFWLLEVGLGGRLDACNIVGSDVAVITSIDLDHMDWLGDTREKIGFEKAGIARAGRPLICMDPQPPNSIADYAHEIGAEVYFRTDFSDDDLRSVRVPSGVILDLEGVKLPPASVAAALVAVDTLINLDSVASTEIIQKTLSGLILSGRTQRILRNGKEYILDVGHNPAAMSFVLDRLRCAQTSSERPQKIDVVLAMMQDKSLADCVAVLGGVVDRWYLCDLPGNPRAASAKDLKSRVLALECVDSAKVAECSDVASALKLTGEAANDHCVLVVGSFFTVAAALSYLSSPETTM